MIARSALNSWFLGYYAAGVVVAILVLLVALVLSLLRRVSVHASEAVEALHRAGEATAVLGRIDDIGQRLDRLAERQPQRNRRR